MRIVILMLAALLVVTGIGCGATRGPKVPAGATAGAWDGKCEAGLFNTCTSQEAADALDVADVWCRWQGPDVIVHVAMHSHFSARLKVAVIPRYVIKDGGTHGNSSAPTYRAPSRRRQPGCSTSTPAGRGEGVLPGTKIAKCNPKLQDAEIIALADAIRLERRHRGRHPAR